MTVGLQHKRAIGAFTNRQDAEAALEALKNADFPMNKVSVVVRDADREDEIATSESEFIRNKTAAGLGKGVLAGGTLGGIAGILVGLATLALPGVGSVILAGTNATLAGLFAGGYYGAAAGGIIGAFAGNGMSKEQIRAYSDRLERGDYLMMIDGSDEDVRRAESILSDRGIQDWVAYTTT